VKEYGPSIIIKVNSRSDTLVTRINNYWLENWWLNHLCLNLNNQNHRQNVQLLKIK
jgi:hypothetical protein